VVANDTGPMHVAAALDRPLVVVWGSGDPRQTRPLSPRSRLVGRFELPCVPCLEATCPRSGAGYVADRARRECLRLVTVDRVEDAVDDLLAAAGGEREERDV
jgi:ADP-heptose:LPS heptosyltransferase